MKKYIILEIGYDDKIVYNLNELFSEIQIERIKKYLNESDFIHNYELYELDDVINMYSFIKNENDLNEVISSFFRDEEEIFECEVLDKLFS